MPHPKYYTIHMDLHGLPEKFSNRDRTLVDADGIYMGKVELAQTMRTDVLHIPRRNYTFDKPSTQIPRTFASASSICVSASGDTEPIFLTKRSFDTHRT